MNDDLKATDAKDAKMEELPSNDYEITTELSIEGRRHSATIRYVDGQPTVVSFNYSPTIPVSMIRQVQSLIHAGCGPSFRAVGMVQPYPYPSAQGAGHSPIAPQPGPNPVF